MPEYPSNRLFPPWLNSRLSQGPAIIFLRLIVSLRLLASPHGRPNTTPLKLTTPFFNEGLQQAVEQIQTHLPGFRDEDIDGNFGPVTRRALAELIGVDVETIPADVFGVRLNPTWWAGPHHEGLLPWPLESVVGPCPGCARTDTYTYVPGDEFGSHNLCVSCGHTEITLGSGPM